MTSTIQRNNMYRKMVTENPEKYPSRMGISWSTEEDTDLLNAAKNKETIQAIASHHQRTTGSIRSRLNHNAVKFHEEKKTVEEIQELTGLTYYQVQYAIEKSNAMKELNASKREAKKEVKKTEPTMSEVIAMISDIQKTVHKILDQITVKPTPSVSIKL
jgi:hypothetical protein